MRTSDDSRSLPRAVAASGTTVVSQSVRAKVIADAQPLLTAHQKCKDLWSALQVADYKKQGILNDAAVVVMYEREKDKFQELLLVASSDELQQMLDENEDGFLNEDEQLLIFSLIKERMQSSADSLCAIHEYSLYKEMMRGIRLLESDIVAYQETLRKRTHTKELTAYRELGEEKLQKFQEDWKRRFALFQEETEGRDREMQGKQEREAWQLEEEIRREKHTARNRTKAKVRNLMVEERLVAINERFQEAQKIHTELKSLESEEIQRAESQMQNDHEKRRNKLRLVHSKELRQMQLKSQTAYNTLKIKMKQQYSRLHKEIKLYLNDIKKNQNLALRLARKLGETRDELRRTKRKAKEMMEAISEAKVATRSRMVSRHTESMGSLGSMAGSSLPQLSSGRTSAGHIGSASVRSSIPNTIAGGSPVRQSVKVVTKFSISSDTPGTERPINNGSLLLKTFSRSKFAAEMIGAHTSKTALQSLGKLYTDELQAVDISAEGETT